MGNGPFLKFLNYQCLQNLLLEPLTRKLSLLNSYDPELGKTKKIGFVNLLGEIDFHKIFLEDF